MAYSHGDPTPPRPATPRAASNVYSGNTLKTTIPGRDVAIPDPENFDDYWRKYSQMFKPKANPGVQAAAIRPSAMAAPSQPTESRVQAGAPPTGAAGYVDTFGVPIGTGINSSGMAMQAWSPGMPFTPGFAPVYTGAWGKNILNVKPETATIQTKKKTTYDSNGKPIESTEE